MRGVYILTPQILTIKQACVRLGIKNEQGLRELIRAGVPFAKAVKRKKWKYWIFADRLEAFLKGGCNNEQMEAVTNLSLG